MIVHTYSQSEKFGQNSFNIDGRIKKDRLQGPDCLFLRFIPFLSLTSVCPTDLDDGSKD